MDVEVAAALRDSGGVLARRDHPALASRLNRLARSDRLWSPLPGIYVAAEVRERPEARILAGALWCGPDSVVCGQAAARLSFWPDCRVDVVVLAVPGRRREARPGYLVTQRRIGPDLLRQAGAVRFTAPALTAVDLAAGPVGGEAIDRVLRARAATLAEMRSALADSPGRVGNRVRAELLEDSRDEPWSEAERELHRLLRNAAITGWRANQWIGDEVGGYVADVCFEAAKVILEVDGYAVHGGREAFESDRRRRNVLVLAGYVVLNFTWRQLVEQPDWVLSCVRQALSRC